MASISTSLPERQWQSWVLSAPASADQDASPVVSSTKQADSTLPSSFGAVLDEEALALHRGGQQDAFFNDMRSRASISQTSTSNLATGTITISVGAFTNSNGLPMVIQNTGNNVIIHAGAVLGADGFGYVRDPESGRYEKFPQLGALIIEDDVEIGANATIDRGALGRTIIRRGVKIDNMVHIGHNVSIGENVVIAAQTGISGSTTIEKDVVIGGQVGIGDHATVEAGAILGSGSGVLSKKIVRGKGTIFWGRPARPLKQYLRELAVVARLAKADKE